MQRAPVLVIEALLFRCLLKLADNLEFGYLVQNKMATGHNSKSTASAGIHKENFTMLYLLS